MLWGSLKKINHSNMGTGVCSTDDIFFEKKAFPVTQSLGTGVRAGDEGKYLEGVVYKNLREISSDKRSTINLNWYTFLEKNHNRPLNVNEMAEVIQGIHNLIREDKILYIDNLLGKVLDESSSQESIVVLLRSSFSIKEKLPNWKRLYENARIWLSNKKLDPDTILIHLA